MDVNADEVAKAFLDHKVSLMIHGHTHRPGIHELNVDGKDVKRIVLGDWYSQGSVLEFNTVDDFTLKSFN